MPESSAPLRRLTIEATSRCNFSCQMCFRRNWFNETPCDMSDSVFAGIARSLPGLSALEKVTFGGMGEPLLHPKITQMVRVFAAHAEVELITNGSLLTPRMSERLRDAGLSRLWLSIDGFSSADDGIRPGSDFTRLCENLAAFAALPDRPALGLTFVVMPDNRAELNKINAFADRYGADLCNISHMIPSRPLSPDRAIYDAPIPVGKMRRLGGEILPKGYDRCPFVEEGAAFVRADGDIAPCMQLLHNADTYLFEEKRHVCRAAFGNVVREEIGAVWEKPEYRAFRVRVERFDFPCCTVCLGCEDRKSNQTDCMYNPFPTCGACLWSQGKIFCP